MSIERLFFMKAIAFRGEMDSQKRVEDFDLVTDYFFDRFRSPDYVINAKLRAALYRQAPNGTIFGGKY